MRSCPVCDALSPISPLEELDADKGRRSTRSTASRSPEPPRPASVSWLLVPREMPQLRLEHSPAHRRGDPAFYALLTSGERYYETGRWEFGQVGRLIPARASVIDIGCGEGWFLRGLPESVRRAGLDHNGRRSLRCVMPTPASKSCEGTLRDMRSTRVGNTTL